MTIKDQFKTLKDNWLLILVVLVVLVVVSMGGNSFTSFTSSRGGYLGGVYMDEAVEMEYAAPMMAKGAYMPYPSGDFAPEVEERKITKTASLSTEVERGTFAHAETQLKNIVAASDAYLLNENSRKQETGLKEYYSGSYTIKVDSEKYDSVIAQLREIGEVQSFSEDADDVTGRYTDLEVELEAEKERLKRFQDMYEEADEMQDKINLNDRIFNQERTIKYYEERLESMDSRIDYSTLYVSISEKRSEYWNVAFVKFSALIRSLVGSVNSLLTLLFVVLPYAVAIGLIAIVVKVVRRKKKRR